MKMNLSINFIIRYICTYVGMSAQVPPTCRKRVNELHFPLGKIRLRKYSGITYFVLKIQTILVQVILLNI